MKLKKIVNIFLLALFVFLQIYLFFIKNFQVLDYSRYMNEFPQPLYGKDNRTVEVSQTFRTPGPLARIDILLANYKVKPKGGTLQLGIFKDNRCLFLKKYPANIVEDNKFYTFAIDPGKVAAGKYTLQLKHFPEDKKERLAVWIFRKDIYPYGNLYIKGKQKPGDMTFRVYYLSTLWQQKGRVIEKIPPLWLSRFWIVIGFLLTLLTINFLFYFFIKKLLNATAP
jgi:hypothetical protein